MKSAAMISCAASRCSAGACPVGNVRSIARLYASMASDGYHNSPAAALATTAAMLPTEGSAIELKNFRSCYAPLPYGATRLDAKCLPGDFLFLTYDIEGLKFDEQTGKASFVTVLELFDENAKLIFNKETPNEVIAQLGGSRPQRFLKRGECGFGALIDLGLFAQLVHHGGVIEELVFELCECAFKGFNLLLRAEVN